jgi:hypothetical protein
MQCKYMVISLIIECRHNRKGQPAIRELGVMLDLRGVVVLFVLEALALAVSQIASYVNIIVLRISLLHPPMKIFAFHTCSCVCYLTTLSIKRVFILFICVPRILILPKFYLFTN